MKKISFWLSTILFLFLSTWLTQRIVSLGQEYKGYKEKYAEALYFKDRLLDDQEWFGKEEVQAVKLKKARIWADTAVEVKALTNKYAAFLGLVVLFYLILCGVLFGRQKNKLIAGVIMAALICLVAGLFTPMIELAAYERDVSIPVKFDTGFLGAKIDFTQVFAGDMFFYYQSKSVVELIGLLLKQNNYVVGLSILFFSLIIPFLKIVFTLLVAWKNDFYENKLINFWIKYLGKWSMADVFVVALFLGFLAFNNMQTGISTESKILPGLYFFFAYVVLSVFSSSLIKSPLSKKI